MGCQLLTASSSSSREKRKRRSGGTIEDMLAAVGAERDQDGAYRFDDIELFRAELWRREKARQARRAEAERREGDEVLNKAPAEAGWEIKGDERS